MTEIDFANVSLPEHPHFPKKCPETLNDDK